jgi:polyhydroxybutyrate depolymerase
VGARGQGARNPDVAFFDAMLDDLRARYCVDPNRVFATGFSRGGFFVNALACERGDKLAAIAPQSGGGPYWPDSAYNADGFLRCPTPAVPALIIHGNADEVVPNVATPGSQNGGWQAFDHWAYWNHPSPRPTHRPTTDQADPAPCVEARDLPPDHPVMACFVDGLGHDTWSEESLVVWDFFSGLP